VRIKKCKFSHHGFPTLTPFATRHLEELEGMLGTHASVLAAEIEQIAGPTLVSIVVGARDRETGRIKTVIYDIHLSEVMSTVLTVSQCRL
jgi:hypothetical protein